MAKPDPASRGAKYYRDSGIKAAWYRRVIDTWEVSTRKSKRAPIAKDYITDEQEAQRLVDEFIDGKK